MANTPRDSRFTKRLLVWITPKMHNQLWRVAKAQERSLSQVVRIALRDWLASHETADKASASSDVASTRKEGNA